MAKIYIEPAKAKATLSQQMALERALQALSQDVGGIRSGLNYKISGRELIDARLRDAVNQISKETDSAKAMRAALEQIISRYEQAENSNTDRVAAEKTSIQNGGNGGGTSSGGGGDDGNHDLKDWKDALEEIIKKLWPIIPIVPGIIPVPILPIPPLIFPASVIKDIFFPYSESETKIKSGAEVDLEEVYKDNSVFKKFDDFKKAHTETLKDSKFYWDPKTGKKTVVDPNDKDAVEEFSKHNKGTVPVDITLLGVGTSNIIAGYHGKGDFSGKYGGGEGEVYLNKLEGTAEAHAGWGYAGASLGASYTAFSASEKAYLGSEDFNVYEEVKVEAGRVGVKGEARAGWVDKEGKVNPSLYAGASAEMIAGEVSGKVGTKLGGVDVAAEGSLNYGLGAHANVGYHDGKFSLDIGATVGVGGSVKIDIDVSGAVKAVGEAADKAWSGVKNFFGF